MTARAKQRKPKDVPPLYVGAQTCDFRPEWVGCDPELAAMLEACHAADPDELTPQLVLADMLAERNDPREKWVRVGVSLWRAAAQLLSDGPTWDYEAARKALAPVCADPAGWRLANLWGCLVAWHAPAGDGRPMGRTWVDVRVKVVQRSLWWWGMGFLSEASAAWSQAYAAWSQAEAAWRQAYAAESRAYAAWRQADAAWRWRLADAAGSQAEAAWRLADAAWSQADAAGSQAAAAWRLAGAAGSQAEAAWRQADAAWRLADAAGSQVWSFARAAWELCLTKLPELNAV